VLTPILYSDDTDATRATLAKILGTRSVDAGDGSLIFALPPAELDVHPAEWGGRAELYLRTDDVAATVGALQAKGVRSPGRSRPGLGARDGHPSPEGSSSASTSPSTHRRHNRTELDPPQVGPLQCGRRKKRVRVLHLASWVPKDAR
jgi:hypothetical protein